MREPSVVFMESQPRVTDQLLDQHPIPGPELATQRAQQLRFVLFPACAFGVAWGAHRLAVPMPFAIALLAVSLFAANLVAISVGLLAAFAQSATQLNQRVRASLRPVVVVIRTSADGLEIQSGGEFADRFPWSRVSVEHASQDLLVIHVEGAHRTWHVNRATLAQPITEDQWSAFQATLLRHSRRA